MLYRRKVLLGLLETFAGQLERVDLQKLLFLLNQKTIRQYYDFFPHRYGCFSVVAAQDLEYLESIGTITTSPWIRRVDPTSFLAQLQPHDGMAIEHLSRSVGSLRGRDLIRHTYIHYPYTAVRSTLSETILTPGELEAVRAAGTEASDAQLFTLGYEGLSLDAFLDLLVQQRISLLIDVRHNPVSMKPGFSRRPLAAAVRLTGADYLHLPELGIPGNLRRNLATSADYTALFTHYRDTLLPIQQPSMERISDLVYSSKRVALTCFEADPHCCHRRVLAEAIADLNDPLLSIKHLSAADRPAYRGHSENISLFIEDK